MAPPAYVLLEDRGFLAVKGDDARSFLQGLVSNNVDKVDARTAIHAAFLTPQGKYLHDFFMVEHAGGLLLDCEAARAPDLMRRLRLDTLRATVTVENAGADFAAAAVFGEGAAEAVGLAAEAGRAGAFAGGVAYVDPRLAAAGVRLVLARAGAAARLDDCAIAPGEPGDYDRMRLRLGLPDGSNDLPVDKAILLENGFEELNGVDFEKGCYLGQEVTARTKYRGLVRKRLMPVDIDGAAPPVGTPVMLEGREAGEMRSSHGAAGLALMRLESVEAAARDGAPLIAGEATVTPRKPDWAAF
jgi:folate-binding protein YgfZ